MEDKNKKQDETWLIDLLRKERIFVLEGVIARLERTDKRLALRLFEEDLSLERARLGASGERDSLVGSIAR